MSIDDDRTDQCANQHNPCELLIDFQGARGTVDIWDMTDKNSPFLVSSTPYEGNQYTHSGWWSADKNYIFIHDELDEQRLGLNTTLRTLDITNLTSPVVTHTWTGPYTAIDHNGFTKGDRYYMSNYRAGLTVLDVSNPNDISMAGYFDTFSIPAENTAGFNSVWGTYPYLASGNLLASDIEYGLFVLKDKSQLSGYTPSAHIASCSAFKSGGEDAGGNAGDNPNSSEPVDSDGDGVNDNLDAFPNDPAETVDSDGDGVGDNGDAFPDNAAASVDADGDGVPDAWNTGCDQTCQADSGLKPESNTANPESGTGVISRLLKFLNSIFSSIVFALFSGFSLDWFSGSEN